MTILVDAIVDGILDTARVLPFLFVTYLLMEYLEHRTGERTIGLIRRADRLGPVFGGVLGIIPQCGFSAAASGFYAGGVITAGTLIAVFLSTSDEMLPLLVSSQVPMRTILSILLIKAGMGVVFGLLIDILFPLFNIRRIGGSIHDLCEHDHCGCEQEQPHVLRSAVKHTMQIIVFLLIINILLNVVVEGIGTEVLSRFVLNRPVIGELLAALIGLIPNCAASILITELYLEGAMTAGAMMSGLLVGAGVGILLLLRQNRNVKESLLLIGLLYVCGVLGGLLIEFSGIIL